MNKEPLHLRADFRRAMHELGPRGRAMAHQFAKAPTGSNQSYAIGYIAALYGNSLLSSDGYHYLLALFGRVMDTHEVADAIKEYE